MQDARRIGALAIGLGLGLSFGCTNPEPAPSPAVEVVRGGEPRAELTVVDLRDGTRGWLFDGRPAPLELDSMLLVCPNGAWMRLRPWLLEQDASFGLGLGDLERATFALAREEWLAYQAFASTNPDCEVECHFCPDQGWICACVGAGEAFGREDPATTSDGAEGSDAHRDPRETASTYESAASDGESPQSRDSADETPSGQPDPSM